MIIEDLEERFKHILRIIFLLKKKTGYKMIVSTKKLAFNFIVYDKLVMLISPLLDSSNQGVRSIALKGLDEIEVFKKHIQELEKEAGKWTNEKTINFLQEECRKKFDNRTGKGRDYLFSVRENYSDFTFINTFFNNIFLCAISTNINFFSKISKYVVLFNLLFFYL